MNPLQQSMGIYHHIIGSLLIRVNLARQGKAHALARGSQADVARRAVAPLDQAHSSKI